jgi:putative ABC transport system substrate-binding protein
MARSFDAGAADIVVASGGAAVDAARQQITSVPLFIVTNNTVGLGLVSSLARPGKNVSGFDLATDEFAPKWLERMAELLPNSRRIAVLMGEERETRSQFEAISAAAPSLKREYSRSWQLVAISTGLLRMSSQVVLPPRSRARTHRLRCSGRHLLPPRLVRVCRLLPNRIFTMDGGLISYGPDFSVVFRRVGILVAASSAVSRRK